MVHEDVVRAVATGLGLRTRGHLLQDPSRAGFDYWMVGWDRLREASRWWFERHGVTARWVGDLSQVGELDHTVRVGTTADGDHLAEVAEEIRSDLGDAVVLQAWPAVVAAFARRTIHLLEAFGQDVDKWTMLRRLTGGSMSEVMAIGDGLNDIQMVENAGIGVAMGVPIRGCGRWPIGRPALPDAVSAMRFERA